MSNYAAAIREGHTHNLVASIWYMESNIARIYDTPDRNLIWATSVYDVARELDRLYPDPSGYSKCLINIDRVILFTIPYFDKKQIKDGIDFEKCKRFLTNMTDYADGQQDGIIKSEAMWISQQLLLYVEHDTDEYRRKREEELAYEKYRPINGNDYRALLTCFEKHLGWFTIIDRSTSQPFVLQTIRNCLLMIEMIYGHGSFRQLSGWQLFVDKWRLRKAQTTKKLHEINELKLTFIDDFISFMDREANKPAPVETVNELTVPNTLGFPL